MGTQLNAFTVHVTSGAAPAEIFTATALSGTYSKANDAQTGAHGVALAQPIIATLKDQTNAPIAGVTLQFATANAGGLLKIGTGTAAATVSGVTDAQGQVSVVWTLGTATGANTTTVSIPAALGVATVNFTATGT